MQWNQKYSTTKIMLSCTYSFPRLRITLFHFDTSPIKVTLNLYIIIYSLVCVKMTTLLKVTPWHHIYSNIINVTQQYYKHYTTIYRLLYSVLDIVGQEKFLYKEQQIAGRVFQLFFLPRDSLLFVHVYKWLTMNDGMMLF